jgi:integrase/recombinase XerD
MIVSARATAAYVSRFKVMRDPSAHTLKAYTSDLKDYATFLDRDGLCPRQQVTVVAYARHLMGERTAAPRTLRRRMACLRGFYKDLVRSGTIDQSPFTGLEMHLPRPRSLPRALTRAETKLLVDAAWALCRNRQLTLNSRAFAAAVLLLVCVGLRVSELVQLSPDDFDPDAGALRVRGKGRRECCVFVVDGRLRSIMALLARRPGADRLFGPSGENWSTQSARRSLRRFADGAGVSRPVTPHMLRHTCATLLLEDGVDLRFLQRLRRALESAGLLSSLSGKRSGRPMTAGLAPA